MSRPVVVLGAAALLGACGQAQPETSPRSYRDYAGREELHAEFAVVSEGVDSGEDALVDGAPWLLRLDGASWEARHGEDWPEAASLGAWTAVLDGGLFLEDAAGLRVQLLPERLAEGETGEGVEVTALGAAETWYGTFDDAVTVEVSEGDWAGRQVLARDFGLVIWTFRGEERELRYYE